MCIFIFYKVLYQESSHSQKSDYILFLCVTITYQIIFNRIAMSFFSPFHKLCFCHFPTLTTASVSHKQPQILYYLLDSDLFYQTRQFSRFCVLPKLSNRHVFQMRTRDALLAKHSSSNHMHSVEAPLIIYNSTLFGAV